MQNTRLLKWWYGFAETHCEVFRQLPLRQEHLVGSSYRKSCFAGVGALQLDAAHCFRVLCTQKLQMVTRAFTRTKLLHQRGDG